jgi:hypothetical protein
MDGQVSHPGLEIKNGPPAGKKAGSEHRKIQNKYLPYNNFYLGAR